MLNLPDKNKEHVFVTGWKEFTVKCGEYTGHFSLVGNGIVNKFTFSRSIASRLSQDENFVIEMPYYEFKSLPLVIHKIAEKIEEIKEIEENNATNR